MDTNSKPLKRVRYSSGQVLSADDLKGEQEYFLEKHRRHNRTLHGAGVIWGLEVSRRKDSVVVLAGLALDCRGEEIFIDEAVESAWPQGVEKAYLNLYYAEKETDPIPAIGGGEDALFSRITESYRLSFEPEDPSSKHKWSRGRLIPCEKVHGIPLAKLISHNGRWRIDRRFRRPRVRI